MYLDFYVKKLIMKQNVIILFNPKDDESKKISNLPLSMLYLERMVRDLDVELIIIDERITNNYFHIIEEKKEQLLFIGVSAMISYQIISGANFSKKVKEISNVPIVWGGWFATSFTEIVLKENFVDFIICGQGEIPFREFVISLLEKKDYTRINGLGYKANGQLFINNNDEILDEKSFPLVDFTKIDLNAIVNISGIVPEPFRSVNYLASTGCPHNCSFCCLASVWGRKFYAKEVDVVIDNILYFKKTANINRISFDDDNFFTNKRFVLDFCSQILAQNIQLEWDASAHPGSFLKLYSDGDLDLFYKAGCRTIRFGSESADEEVLRKINKKLTPEITYDVVRKLKKHKLKPVLYLMVAFPWNPDKDFKSTINMVGKAKLIDSSLEAGINFFVPLPKTPIYQECLENNYPPYNSFDGIIEFINKNFTAPWWKHNYRKELQIFLRFYFKYSNINYFKSKYGLLLIPALLANILFFPPSYFRLKYGFYKFPFEAYIYFSFKKLFSFIGLSKFDDDKEAIARTRSWKR